MLFLVLVASYSASRGDNTMHPPHHLPFKIVEGSEEVCGPDD